jgi:signal transduction histidine kinase
MKHTTRVSRIWLSGAALAIALAALAAGAAALRHAETTRAVGEGELFAEEAAAAAVAVEHHLASGMPLDVAVRRVRHALGIEGVGVIDPDGTVVASTSASLVGSGISNPYVGFVHSSGRFGAIATPSAVPIQIDEVTEWQAGDVLYQVIQPLGDGRSLSLHYDVAGLLARRAGERRVHPLTLQLAGGSAVLLATGLVLLWGRSVSKRRIAESLREAELLAQRSEELEEHNRRLDEARTEAERALALAEETNRVRSEFVLMINHELRTPLTSVITGTDLLRDGELGDEQRTDLLEDMQRDGRRLMELISNMLAVARIENRGLDYALRPTAVADVLGSVAASTGAVRRTAAEPGVSGRRLRTDRDGLTHLLVSLAENAVTHGAESVEVRVATELPGDPAHSIGAIPDGAIHFLVVDDGPGIDPSFLPRAFEKFEKHSFSSGTGLGLYVVRLMAEAIEASVTVFTGTQGTTMAVSVPCDIAGDRVAA